MKFRPDGADIPEDLIRSFLTGEAIFLCGAGVSMCAGLWSFETLVEKVYAALGESLDNDPAERHAYNKQEHDRVLRSLEKRISPPYLSVSPVRSAVERLLQPPTAASYPEHLNLLRISKDQGGRPRVLTTNFDTLFEHAALPRWKDGLPSHAEKALPSAGGPKDHGVLHLHGRLADATLGLPASELILTSSDFGRAYLRDGWASRYLEDRMRLGPIVLIGYGADDVAVRLLMETLDADRDRFSDLKDVYAIDCRDGESFALWRAKGIIPIEFAEKDFASLYATIAEWANLADAPTEFAKTKLVSTFMKPPSHADAFLLQQLPFLVETFGADKVLVDLAPSTAWLLHLIDQKLIEWADPAIGAWITQNLHDPIAVKHVAANADKLSLQAAELLAFRLEDAADLPAWLHESWRLIARHVRIWSDTHRHTDWFGVQRRIVRGDRSPDAMQHLAALMRPNLKIGRLTGVRDTEKTPARPADVMRIELAPNPDASHTDFLEMWPEDTGAEDDARLLGYLTSNLEQALDDAVALKLDSNQGHGLTDFDVPSVADHRQNEHRTGFLALVRTAAELWMRLAGKNAAIANIAFERWSNSPHKLIHRLALFAACNHTIEAHHAAALVARMDADELFLTGAEVEVFRMLAERWSDFTPDQRSQIERRLREGPPAERFREGADIAYLIDRCRFDLLSGLRQEGCTLTVPSQDLLTEIGQRHPEWEPRPVERIGFWIWDGGSWGGTIGDPEPLRHVPDDLLVETAMRMNEEEIDPGNAWRALCKVDPDHALRGLVADVDKGNWREAAWRSFLWESKELDQPEDLRTVATMLSNWPDQNFREMADTVSHWLSEKASEIPSEAIWPLWDKIERVADQVEAPDESFAGSLGQAINHPGGRLAEALIKRLSMEHQSGSLSDELMERFTRLADGKDTHARLARVAWARNLSFLFFAVPAWTTDHMLQRFDWEKSEEAPELWSAWHASGNVGQPELIEAQKSPFLELFERPEIPTETKSRYAEWLPIMALSNARGQTRYPVSMQEARSALRRAGARAMSSVAHQLATAMEAVDAGDRGKHWRELVGPIFAGIWPLDAELQSETATYQLVRLLLKTGDAFAEAAKQIVPFLRPESQRSGLTVYAIYKADSSIYETAPEQVLELADAVVGDAGPQRVYRLSGVLDQIVKVQPDLVNRPAYHRLRAVAG